MTRTLADLPGCNTRGNPLRHRGSRGERTLPSCLLRLQSCRSSFQKIDHPTIIDGDLSTSPSGKRPNPFASITRFDKKGVLNDTPHTDRAVSLGRLAHFYIGYESFSKNLKVAGAPASGGRPAPGNDAKRGLGDLRRWQEGVNVAGNFYLLHELHFFWEIHSSMNSNNLSSMTSCVTVDPSWKVAQQAIIPYGKNIFKTQHYIEDQDLYKLATAVKIPLAEVRWQALDRERSKSDVDTGWPGSAERSASLASV